MEPFIGQIMMFAGNFPPRGWAFCDGQLLSIAQNSALFSLLGTMYGGDGRTTFGLPDLRGRVPLHHGNGPGLSTYHIGERGGVERVQLSSAQMPAHTHTAHAYQGEGSSNIPTGNCPAKSGTGSYHHTSDVQMQAHSVGGGQSHYNLQPHLGISFCIALQGLYPSRN